LGRSSISSEVFWKAVANRHRFHLQQALELPGEFAGKMRRSLKGINNHNDGLARSKAIQSASAAADWIASLRSQ
jgi:hypothetical protein